MRRRGCRVRYRHHLQRPHMVGCDAWTEGPRGEHAAKCYRLLRTIMGTAVEDGLVIANPCTIKGAGVEPSSERPIITVAQAFELADLVGPRLRSIVLLSAFVGLRKGEMLGLRRGDLDLDAGVVCVDQQRQLSRNGTHLVGPPKTDAGRRAVSIPASLIEDLRHHVDHYAQPGDDGYVLTGTKGGPLAPHVLQKAWAAARAQLDLDDVHLHDLRHLAGTIAAGTGAGTKELMHRLATPATKPPSATNTQPESATSPSQALSMGSLALPALALESTGTVRKAGSRV